MQFSCQFYSPKEHHEWNRLVSISRQATFLFHRDFMEYHGSRFKDASLMVFEAGQLKMILPANRVSATKIASHEGLTYGGFVFHPACKSVEKLRLIKSCLDFLAQEGIETIRCKAIPPYFIPSGNGEISYALQKLKAKFIRCDYASVLPLQENFNYQERRKRGIRKAGKRGLEVVESAEWELFWEEALAPNLKKKYGLPPVHSLAEISYLKNEFPENIRLFTVAERGAILSGTVLFETATCDHAQYIASTKKGVGTGSSDLLFDFLIRRSQANQKAFFGFGVSQEQQGKVINQGLTEWKESWGCQSFPHEHWQVDTKNAALLKMA